MTIFERLLNYFIRARNVKLTAMELSRVNNTNYNTTRRDLGKMIKQGKVIKLDEKRLNPKTGRYVSLYQFTEEPIDYVKKYLSSVLYCGMGNSHHGIKKVAYAYTYELKEDEDIPRYDDLYEEIRKYNRNCYELDLDELDQFGKNYGYGVEGTKRVEAEFIYPKIAVKVDGVLLN